MSTWQGWPKGYDSTNTSYGGDQDAIDAIEHSLGKCERRLEAAELRLAAYENLRAVAHCTRFTMIPCTDRPEILERDYCPTCAALTVLDRLDQEKS